MFDVFAVHAVDHVPVCGGDDGHLVDGEILEDDIEGCCGTCAACGRDAGGGFSDEFCGSRVEEAIEESQDSAVGGSVVNGGSDDDGIGSIEFLGDFCNDVVGKDTVSDFAALAAGGATANVVANPDDFGINAVSFECSGDFFESSICAAVLACAAVDEQYFHFLLLLCCNTLVTSWVIR